MELVCSDALSGIECAELITAYCTGSIPVHCTNADDLAYYVVELNSCFSGYWWARVRAIFTRVSIKVMLPPRERRWRLPFDSAPGFHVRELQHSTDRVEAAASDNPALRIAV